MDSSLSVPTTSFFVACTFNATNTIQYLPMQNGQAVLAKGSSLNQFGSEPWKIWSPDSVTELTQAVLSLHTLFFIYTNICYFSSMLPKAPFHHIQLVYMSNYLMKVSNVDPCL